MSKIIIDAFNKENKVEIIFAIALVAKIGILQRGIFVSKIKLRLKICKMKDDRRTHNCG